MPKLSDILGESYNSLPEETKTKYKDVDLVDSSEYVKKSLFDAKEGELSTTKDLLKEANKTIKSYEDTDIETIKKNAEDYKTKLEEANKTIEKQQKESAAKDLFSNYEFINERTKKSVLNEFLEKDFKLENDKFLGGEEWLKNLTETESDIFKQKDNPEGEDTKKNDGQKPQFTNPLNGSQIKNTNETGSLRGALAGLISK